MGVDINIFLSYADEDEKFMKALKKSLHASDINNVWGQDMLGGDDWERKTADAFDRADIILLLISPDFFNSDRCKEETKRALERSDTGKVRTIPILLRPTFYAEDHLLLKLQMLPSNRKPVTDWKTVDGAYKDITSNIHLVIKEILPIKKAIKEKYAQYICAAERFFMEEKHQEALETYKKAVRLASNYSYLSDHLPSLYKKEGDSFRELNRLEEALTAYEKAVQLEPKNREFYECMGDVLVDLNRFELALKAYNCSAECPDDVDRYMTILVKRAPTLRKLQRFKEALEDYEWIIKNNSSASTYYKEQGELLFILRRFEDARKAYEQAIDYASGSSDVDIAELYKNKGNVLFKLKRYELALQAYEEAIKRDPTNFQAWCNRARALKELADKEPVNLKKALAAYEEALKLAPEKAFLYREKGKVLLLLDHLEEALEAYNQAISREPGFGFDHLQVACIFDRLAKRFEQYAEQARETARKLAVPEENIVTSKLSM
jgi:tetratricopeptide (TPR) repeat protein